MRDISLFHNPADDDKPPRLSAYARNKEDREARLSLQRRILESLSKSPATCEELCDRLNGKHQSVSPSILSLRKNQLIFWDGKAKTRSGKSASICHIGPKGIRLLNGEEHDDNK